MRPVPARLLTFALVEVAVLVGVALALVIRPASRPVAYVTAALLGLSAAFIVGLLMGGAPAWRWFLRGYGMCDVPPPRGPLKLTTLSERAPFVQLIDNFISPEECQHLVALGTGRFARSTTVDRQTGGNVRHPTRTSSTCALRHSEDDVVARIERRAAVVARLPVANVEPLQLTRYGANQQYGTHYDWFDPDAPGFAATTDHGYRDAQGAPVPNQRAVTLFVYLTEPSETHIECAGGTAFPSCSFEVVPKAGSAVLFHNYDELGNEDRKADHGGLPNRCADGSYVKMGLNIWIRRFPWPHGGPSPEAATYLTQRDGVCRMPADADPRRIRRL